MNLITTIIQIIISILLIALILMQAKGTGLGSAFGGSSNFYSSKRGVEKFIFYLTIVIAGLFVFSSILNYIF